MEDIKPDRSKRSKGSAPVPTTKSQGLGQKFGVGVVLLVIVAIGAFVYQKYAAAPILSLWNVPEEKLRGALMGTDPYVFYCQEGIESPPSIFTAAHAQRMNTFMFATLNCSQVLPSGKTIYGRYGLKRHSSVPTVFGVAPWAKHQQLPKASLVDAHSLVTFIDNAFAPKPTPFQSDKELNSLCGFAKDVATARHSVTSTCFVIMSGEQQTDYHIQLANKLVRAHPRSRILSLDSRSRRLSFEPASGPQSKSPDTIAMEIFALRNGTHFLQYNSANGITYDYLNTFMQQAIATPLYGFDEDPYGGIRVVKSKKSQFKDRSQSQQQQYQQQEEEQQGKKSKSKKSKKSDSSSDAGNAESSESSGKPGRDNTGDRIRAQRRAEREAKEREERQNKKQDEKEQEDEEEDEVEEEEYEEIIEL